MTEKWIVHDNNDLNRSPNPEYILELTTNIPDIKDAMRIVMKDYRGTVNPAYIEKILKEKYDG